MSVAVDNGEFALFGFAEDGVGFFEGYALWGGDEVREWGHDGGDEVSGGCVELDVSEGYYTQKFSVEFPRVYAHQCMPYGRNENMDWVERSEIWVYMSPHDREINAVERKF